MSDEDEVEEYSEFVSMHSSRQVDSDEENANFHSPDAPSNKKIAASPARGASYCKEEEKLRQET